MDLPMKNKAELIKGMEESKHEEKTKKTIEKVEYKVSFLSGLK